MLFVVLSNGGYAVMDRLAEQQGGTGSWPSFNVDVCSLARGLGCPAERIDDHPGLIRALDEVLPAGRSIGAVAPGGGRLAWDVVPPVTSAEGFNRAWVGRTASDEEY